jgi:hypothetical protein
MALLYPMAAAKHRVLAPAILYSLDARAAED